MQHFDLAGQPCRVRRIPAARPYPPSSDLHSSSLSRDTHARNNGASVEQLASIASLQLKLGELNPNDEQALAMIAQEGLTAADAEGTAIAIARGPEIVCCARAGSLAPALGTPINTRSGLSGQCLRTGEVVSCDDTDTDARVDSHACRQAGIRSVLMVPIRANNAVIGVFAVFSRYIQAFGGREAGLLQLLAALVSSRTRTASAGEQPSAPQTTLSLQETTPCENDRSPSAAAKDTEPAIGSAPKLSGQNRWASSRQISECLERIRQDPALRLLGRAKAYLTIEALYDGCDRTHAIALFQRLMLQRSDDIGVVL